MVVNNKTKKFSLPENKNFSFPAKTNKLTKIENKTRNSTGTIKASNYTTTNSITSYSTTSNNMATTAPPRSNLAKTEPILIQFRKNTNVNAFTKFTLEKNSENKPTLEIIIPKPGKSLSSETFKYTNERGKRYQMRPYIHDYKEPFYDID